MHVSDSLGYPVLALLVGGESAGLPIPGETAIVVAGIAASTGHLNIVVVMAVAAAAAIIGDNIGFVLGRHGVRRLIDLPGPFAEERRIGLRRSEAFFAVHGGKAVFLARFIPYLRVVGAWTAGASHMEWPVFLVWNALGGIAWAVGIGGLAYVLGHTAERVFAVAGTVGIVGGGLVLLALAIRHRRRGRAAADE